MNLLEGIAVAMAIGYLLFFGRIHYHKGVHEAIEVARRTGMRLVIAGIVQDEAYFQEQVEPHIDGSAVQYIGSVGPEKRQEVLGGALAAAAIELLTMGMDDNLTVGLGSAGVLTLLALI